MRKATPIEDLVEMMRRREMEVASERVRREVERRRDEIIRATIEASRRVCESVYGKRKRAT